ncbi:hypothetical protein [Microbacterium dextranolyticum]|uniref:SDR-like Ig domain-containing protein n=2 Tax=Microbacterium dextranolyticum TaxID=36806 RepID=A0A9W6M5V2_9MICO|nr:hypothetical protein [Microbacterium dextranolyticum]GLJ95206.1 hypothetical protein GCM10017591_12680 [Microbacterium dextranolyticum]
MTRARSLQLGLSALFVAGAVACGTPAWGAAGSALVAQTTTSIEASTTTTEVVWTLPPDAAPGDTVTVALPDHAGGVLGDGRWISASGALIGHASLAADGALSIHLTDAAAEPGNRSGRTLVTTTGVASPGTTTSTGLRALGHLPAGEVPGEFHGTVDRTTATKYGAWFPGLPRVEWTVETPRGPWDVVTVADPAPTGASVDCAAGVAVRSTSRTAPETGYLIDLIPVASERVATTCDTSGVTVSVTPVATDEILEVRFSSDVANATDDAVNVATVTATRTTDAPAARATTLRPVIVPAPSATPSGTPTPVPAPPPSTPTPTPTPPAPPTPTVTPVADRLATTGADGADIGAMAAAGLLALVAGAAATGGARRPHRRGGDPA